MTLTTIPRYEPDRISERSGHAVVVGASMAGILAARVLVDRFEAVTLIERDSLPDHALARPGVPQGNQIHVMLTAGQSTLEDFFPGYGDELTSEGAVEIDLTSDLKVYGEGGFLAPGPNRIPLVSASRPLFEYVTRRRVGKLEGVTIRDECQFVDYLFDDENSSVEGVTVRTGEGLQELASDLVVDASGRTSRTPDRLESHGYPAPSTDEVSVNLTYRTAVLERSSDSLESYIVMPEPPRLRGCATYPIEHGQRILTLAGIHGDQPPADLKGFIEFAASLPVSGISRLLDEHAFVSDDVHSYPFPASIRRHYDDVDRFPDGLLVIGDAIASFNPIYGQGMSVAAMEALLLHHTLATDGLDEPADPFFERSQRIVDDAWKVAVGSDFQFPQTTGPKPFGTDFMNWYIARLNRKAHADGTLADAFVRVVGMERRPTSLFRPGVAWRVLKPGR